MSDIKVCYSEFSKRRANIHGKQEYENGTKVYGGHFYHLLSEYESVVRDKVRDNSRTYHNPHLIGFKFDIKNASGNVLETEDDGVTGASIAYRKFLLKVIKVTDDGQRFGQLLRPKSIAYDDKHKKYYVVDTYHHCIQCFEFNINADDRETNTVLERTYHFYH